MVLSLLLIAQPYTGRSANAQLTAMDTAGVPSVAPDLVNLPLSFVVNAGQTDPEVRFQAHSLGGTLFFTADQVVFSLPAPETGGYVVRLDFVGAGAAADVTGLDRQPGVVNYFIGNDPAQWRTSVPTYRAITYWQLYPGIDVQYEGTQAVLKGTYTVAPGADASLIRWAYRGAAQTRMDPKTGDLQIVLGDTTENQITLTERAPVAWQMIDGQRVPVEIGYAVADEGVVRFELGDYDAAFPLTLDPELQYSTHFGGNNFDIGNSIEIDTSGNAFVTGKTSSSTFPRTSGAYDTTLGGTADAFVAKLNVSIASQKLVYSTYLGGSGVDEGFGIDVGPNGKAFVTGTTTSGDFPVTNGSSRSGTSDAFVTKLNFSGSALDYSTYLGGSGAEGGEDIVVDGSSNAYVTGYTESSSGFPITGGVRQTAFGGVRDAFVVKYNASASIVYATYLGGNASDTGLSVALAGSNQAVVVGKTASTTGFPLDNPLQSSNAGGTDAFATKVSSTGTTFVYSTYLGGTGDDEAAGVVADASGNAYLAGWTASSDFLGSYTPTQTPIQASNAGAEDAFVVELDSPGTTLVYSSYIGGTSTDKAADVALDAQNYVHITGETSSSDFPIESPFPGQETIHTAPDAFVTAIALDTPTYFYSSFLGGSNADRGLSLAVDAVGSILVTGETASSDFPRVQAAYQWGGGSDAFIVRIGSAKADLQITKSASPSEAVIGQPLIYTLLVYNAGPNDTSDVVVQDSLPSQVVYVSSSSSQGSCVAFGSTVTCDIGDIAAGAPAITITINTLVQGSGGSLDNGNIVNTARIIQSSQFDPTTPNEATTSTAVNPDLVVTKTANDYRLPPGSTFTFTIQVTNKGGWATSVQAVDVLSNKVNFVSATASVGTYFNTTGVWTIGTLDYNQTATLTITVEMKSGLVIGDVIPNTVTASSPKPDINPADNTSSINVYVASPYPDQGCHPSPDDPDVVICLGG